MKKIILSTLMAAVISMSAVATSSTVVGAISSNLATPKISKTENVNDGVKISWNKVNKAEVYRVYYKGSKGWTKLADTTSTTYTDSKVSSGKTYTYTVRCLNKSKNKFTSGYDSKGTKATFIATPKISKTENVNGGVKISWGKSNGAEQYRVYYKGSKGWTKLADTTSTTYTDSKVSSGKTYTYTVRCLNKTKNKFTSGYDSKGTKATFISTPKISKTENVNGGVKISWGKSNGAEQYRVYYKGSKGWTKLADTTLTTYTDSKVSSGKTYTYTVRCLNKSKNKFTSGYDSKGTNATFVSAPEITNAEVTYNSITINWDKVAGAEKYRVYRKGENGWSRLFDTTSTTFTDTNLYAETAYIYTVRCINSSANKFTSGYNSDGFTVSTSAPAEHIHTWQDITKEVTYTETITKTEYVEKVRTICNDCGADITGNTEHIFDEIEKGGKGSYRAEKILVPIEKTETVTKTKTEVIGRKCTTCGKVEMFSEEHTHTWQDITKEVTYTENVQIPVCSEPTCCADLSGMTQSEITNHIKQHALKGENSGWHSSTKSVTKTKTEVIGRKCTECGEIEYY